MDLLEHVVPRIQIFMVLIEVADLHLAAEPGLPRDELDLPRDGLQQRGLPGAVQPDDAQLLPALDLQLLQGLVKRIAIPTHARVLQHQGHIAAPLGFRKGELHLAPVLDGIRDAVELGQVRAAAPGLLGVLPRDVAADVLFLLLDVILLAVEMALGQFQFLLFFLHEFRVIAFVGPALAHINFQDAGGDFVQKVAVMRDDHHRRGAVGDKILEPSQRWQIQMVRGLIQQEQILALEHRLGEHYAALLAATKRIHGLFKLILAESQRLQNTFRTGADAEPIEALEGLGHILVARHDHIEVRIGLAHPMLQLPHLVLQLFHVAEGRQGLFQDGPAGFGHQILGIVAHADAPLLGGPDHGALVRLQLAQEQLEDRALACAIAANEAPAFTFFQGPGHVLQHLVGTEVERDMIKGSKQFVSLGLGCGLWAANLETWDLGMKKAAFLAAFWWSLAGSNR